MTNSRPSSIDALGYSNSTRDMGGDPNRSNQLHAFLAAMMRVLLVD
jgi:hypothetical protein